MVEFSPQFGEGLFHGTHRNIEGGSVLPASKTFHRRTNFEGLSDGAHAYATESEDTAWELASVAQTKTHTAESRNPLTGRQQVAPVPGRVRVHEVYPHPDMSPGLYHPDHEDFRGENLSEHVAPEFKIKNTIDVRPGQQGTLNLNWNQFSKHPHDAPHSGDPYNHPSDADIERGHLNRLNRRSLESGPNETLETLVGGITPNGEHTERLF